MTLSILKKKTFHFLGKTSWEVNLLKYLFWHPTGTSGYNYTGVNANATNYTIKGPFIKYLNTIWNI